MKPLTEVLSAIDGAVDRYEFLKLGLIHDQCEILQTLTTNNKHLSDHRIEEHKDWMSHKHNSKASSNAAKESEADMLTPNLYKIRHTQTAIKLIIEGVRTTISANRA